MQCIKWVVVVVFWYVVWIGDYVVMVVGVYIFVVMDNVGFWIFFQCRDWVYRDIVWIDVVYILFFNVCVVVFFLVFVDFCVVGLYLNDVIGIR